MRRIIALLLLTALFLLCACETVVPENEQTSAPEATTAAPETVPETTPPETVPETTEPETTAEEVKTPEEVKTTRISFLAAGDNVVHGCIYNEAKMRATADSREYNFMPIYEDVADLIAAADIAFINQETPMGGAELGYSNYPRFNTPQDMGYTLQELGFDVINIANNHMCDKGEAGLRGTIEFLSSLDGVTLIGGHLSEEDFMNIRVVEKEGVKIAFLAYTYGTNGLRLPSDSALYVPYIDYDKIARQLKLAEEIADLTFVSVHWGQENKFKPNDSQRDLAKFMAEHGADAIIGHHPHVIQPIEWIETESGHRTLCIYSLGNLISAMENGYNMLGGFFTFDIVKEGDEAPYLDAPLFIPTAFYFANNWYSTKLYLLENYDQALSLTHGTRRHGGVASREKMEEYLRDVMDEEFLPAWLRDAV